MFVLLTCFVNIDVKQWLVSFSCESCSLLVNDVMMLQYIGALPEADWTALLGSSAPIHPHSFWCPAHPAHPTPPLHCHPGEHPQWTGSMYTHAWTLKQIYCLCTVHYLYELIDPFRDVFSGMNTNECYEKQNGERPCLLYYTTRYWLNYIAADSSMHYVAPQTPISLFKGTKT